MISTAAEVGDRMCDRLNGDAGYVRAMTILQLLAQPGCIARFTPARLKAVVISSDGSEHIVPAVILEYAILRGFVRSKDDHWVITDEGHEQAARERDRAM